MKDGLVCCTVDERQYAFRDADVCEIARAERMRPDQGPDGRVGILEVGHQLVPVFALGGVLDGASPFDAAGPSDSVARGRYIAVTGEAGQWVGWLVDRIARADVGGQSVIAPLPAMVGANAARWFDAVVRMGDIALLLLAPRRLHPGAAGRPATAPGVPAPAPPPVEGLQAAPMAVIFSTPALPRCQASRYALSGRRVAAVVEPTPPLAVPGSAPHVAGVSWWRDAVVPVVDFREPAARVDDLTRGRRIVARCGGHLRGTLVAFAIDSEVALHRPAAEDRLVPGAECPPFAAGVFSVGGETIALLELDRLISQPGSYEDGQ